MRDDLVQRFLSKTERSATGCLLWTGAQSGGYGTAWNGVKVIKAHRFAYEAWVGSIPDGLIVRHACDVPLCVEPTHLVLGTHRDNMRDMVDRQRSPVNAGERNPRSKLTAEQVEQVRRAVSSGETQTEVARRFGVTSQMIGRIVRGQNWATA